MLILLLFVCTSCGRSCGLAHCSHLIEGLVVCVCIAALVLWLCCYVCAQAAVEVVVWLNCSHHLWHAFDPIEGQVVVWVCTAAREAVVQSEACLRPQCCGHPPVSLGVEGQMHKSVFDVVCSMRLRSHGLHGVEVCFCT